MPDRRETVPVRADKPARRPYAPPAILVEMALEVRAGSPLGPLPATDPLFDPLSDLFGGK